MYKISTLILITIVTLTAQHRPFTEKDIFYTKKDVEKYYRQYTGYELETHRVNGSCMNDFQLKIVSDNIKYVYQLGNDSIKVSLRGKKIVQIDSLFNRHAVFGVFTYSEICDIYNYSDDSRNGLFIAILEDFEIIDYVEYDHMTWGTPNGNVSIGSKFKFNYIDKKIILSYRTHDYETKYLEYPYPPQCQILY